MVRHGAEPLDPDPEQARQPIALVGTIASRDLVGPGGAVERPVAAAGAEYQAAVDELAEHAPHEPVVVGGIPREDVRAPHRTAALDVAQERLPQRAAANRCCSRGG